MIQDYRQDDFVLEKNKILLGPVSHTELKSCGFMLNIYNLSATLWHVQEAVQAKSQESLKCICNLTDDLLYWKC